MKRIFGLIVVLVTLALGTSVFAGAFTPGDVVIYRIGDGTQPITNYGQSVFLDEYTPAAISNGCFFCPEVTPIQSIQMPTSWVGNQAPLIAEGPGSAAGLITLSTDGRFLVLTGYGSTIGQLTNPVLGVFGLTTNGSLSGSSTTGAVTQADIPRVVGLVDGFGHIYTSTSITNVDENADDIRGAASLDGTNIWLSGSSKLAKYVKRGSLVSTQICANTSLSPLRAIGIFGNTLYLDKNNALAVATNTTAILTNIVGGVTNIATVNPFGGALPVVSIPTNFVPISTISPLSGGAFAMFNLANANPGGPDTIYLADASAIGFPGEPAPRGGGVLKYCYISGSWTNVGGISGEDAYGVTGFQSGTNVTLYITENTNTTLYSFTDVGGYGNSPVNNQGTFQSDSAILGPVGNLALINIRGISVVPQGGDSGTITGPGVISVGPPYGPYFRGPQGGPFKPSGGATFSVANLGTTTTNFTVQLSAFTGPVGNWATVTPSTGSLAPGASTLVTVSLVGSATNLNGGQSYTGTLIFHTGGNAGAQVAKPLATIVVDAFYLTPISDFITTGEPGVLSSYQPSNAVYVLSNATPATLSFSAYMTNGAWASVSPVSGSVPGFSTQNITVSLTSGINSLTNFGSYEDQLVVSNVNASTIISTSPHVIAQVGFGFFDNFNTFSVGNVAGQNSWLGNSQDINPVQIVSVNGTNEYVVPGGCVNAMGTSEQPFKYIAAGPVTNNDPATCAIMGMVITFTNAPPSANYVFGFGTAFLSWDDAGIKSVGGGQYVWTTELNAFETGGGPQGTTPYNLNQQYHVFLVADFVNSNAWVFVDPGTNDFNDLLNNVAPAVHSDGLSDCDHCAGHSPQGWDGVTLGQFSSCPGGEQPGYFVTRVGASTNYVDVYNWVYGITNSAPPSDPFTAWQNAYFTPSELSNPAFSGGNADPFGTGMSNTNKFFAGFSPTNAMAYLRIISIAKTNGTDVKVTYLGANGDSTYMPGVASRTNVLEYAAGTGNGSYTNNFQPTGQTNILSGGTGLGTVTNMTDSGGATNVPSRFYRVRVLLP